MQPKVYFDVRFIKIRLLWEFFEIYIEIYVGLEKKWKNAHEIFFWVNLRRVRGDGAGRQVAVEIFWPELAVAEGWPGAAAELVSIMRIAVPMATVGGRQGK